MTYAKTNDYYNIKPDDEIRTCQSMTSDEFIKLVQSSDIVHLNDLIISGMYPAARSFKDKKRVNMLDILHDQKVFRQANGTYYRNNHEVINLITTSHNICNTVTTPDLLKYGGIWIPQPIKLQPFNPPEYTGQIRISHSPSKRKIKGTDLFLEACLEMDLEVVLIENKSHEECMNLRQSCHIHYDQFSIGSYGVSAVEGLALGQVTIVGLHAIRHLIPDHPFVDVYGHKEGLKNAIKEAINTVSDHVFVLKGREWVEKHHSVENVISKLIKLYEKQGYYHE
jgi:DNA-binding protein YbaB